MSTVADCSINQLVAGPISAHSYNKDRSQLAVCPAESSELLIFKRQGQNSKWALAHSLKGHDKPITSVDWAPNTNRIVTCSQDRNAYVWTLDADATDNHKWKPTLVLLRINRAATFVRWSPLENKFAVASGARSISICYFEEENDWWISKHLKKPIRSTVLSLDWHPNNVLLAAGSADMKARVFSAFIKGLDKKPAATPWGERLPFNTVCAEYYNGHGGWVHAVCFSPDGNSLAWVSHDSTLYIATPSENAVREVKTAYLPFCSLFWVSNSVIVAAGHDSVPMVFGYDSDKAKWNFVEKLVPTKTNDQKTISKVGSLAGNAALAKFQHLDSRAQAVAGGGANNNTKSNELSGHINCIKEVRLDPNSSSGSNGFAFSSTGSDGKHIEWKISKLETVLAKLGL